MRRKGITGSATITTSWRPDTPTRPLVTADIRLYFPEGCNVALLHDALDQAMAEVRQKIQAVAS